MPRKSAPSTKGCSYTSKKDEDMNISSEVTDSVSKPVLGNNASDTYASDEKAFLNNAFLKWATFCVDKNPRCDLTSLVEVYKKHRKDFEDDDKDAKDDDKIEVDLEDDYEPPKNDFKPVIEEDSIYSKRCKVFRIFEICYKEGVCEGVGTLHVKKVENGAKAQVIVRADTNLENLLLNMVVSKDTVVQKIGEKDVMVFSVEDGIPTPILLRVKTPEDAKELYDSLESLKIVMKNRYFDALFEKSFE